MMPCNTCGSDPVVLSAMNTIDYETDAVCAACLPGWALGLAINTNPGLLDEDGRHKYVLAIPAGMHDTARELYAEAVYGPGEASTAPAGHSLPEPSDGGSTGDLDAATGPPDADAPGDVDGPGHPDRVDLGDDPDGDLEGYDGAAAFPPCPVCGQVVDPDDAADHIDAHVQAGDVTNEPAPAADQ